MIAEETQSAIKTLHVVKEVLIAAPADVVFQTLLEPHGPMKDMNMKLEPGPAGAGSATWATTPGICGAMSR